MLASFISWAVEATRRRSARGATTTSSHFGHRSIAPRGDLLIASAEDVHGVAGCLMTDVESTGEIRIERSPQPLGFVTARVPGVNAAPVSLRVAWDRNENARIDATEFAFDLSGVTGTPIRAGFYRAAQWIVRARCEVDGQVARRRTHRCRGGHVFSIRIHRDRARPVGRVARPITSHGYTGYGRSPVQLPRGS